MTEPRIRQRQKGQQFPAKDLSQILHAFGDTHTDPFLAPPPSTTTTPSQLHPPFTSALPTTISTLDEIITDFIIETCHEAASIAAYSRRQKIKLDDFKFMLRRDGKKLGRVSEMMEKDRELKRQRQTFDTKEGVV
ncbi:transcription initiation factor IID, 18 kDa subunit, partial [Sporormia fimetaria CBS 119925]